MNVNQAAPLPRPATSGLSVSNATARKPCLLVVDDDRVMLMMLEETLKELGYQVLAARNGEEALTVLTQKAALIDTVILDREMPGMNGLEVVAKLKLNKTLMGLPIIMLTGSGNPEQIQQGIEAGVFYYLVKPVTNALLASVVDSALRERQQKRALIHELIRHDAALKAMHTCHIYVRSLEEAEDTACFLASCFPDPEKVAPGLMELLVNAVEHGNLGITYEEKTALLASGQWQDDIRRRLALPENASKMVDVLYQHKPEGWFVQIGDSGKGFDWRRYWQIDPTRATASHGRGIARARLMAFDKLAYNEAGTQVTAVVHQSPQQTLEW